MCNGQSFSLQSLVDLLGVDALSDESDVEDFVNASLETLFADDMSFAPLLPEDEAALDTRATAIGQWTGSFLAGLVAGLAEQDQRSFASLPEEVQEIVGDFTAITEINLSGDDTDAGEEAEADLMQVQEFVKIGALLVMSLLNDVPDDTGE